MRACHHCFQKHKISVLQRPSQNNNSRVCPACNLHSQPCDSHDGDVVAPTRISRAARTDDGIWVPPWTESYRSVLGLTVPPAAAPNRIQTGGIRFTSHTWWSPKFQKNLRNFSVEASMPSTIFFNASGLTGLTESRPSFLSNLSRTTPPAALSGMAHREWTNSLRSLCHFVASIRIFGFVQNP